MAHAVGDAHPADRRPTWMRLAARVTLFCFAWSNLQFGVEQGYRLGVGMRAAWSGPIADPTAPLAFRPGIGQSGAGVPVVNITSPNQAGLSLNQYQSFDVDPQGAILNNSLNGGGSFLGGAVAGNPNLSDGRTAVTILNEVTTTGSPGSLAGTIEVFGAPATVIIANPNGITCAGCGVINTPRFTLTTGTPVPLGSAGQDVPFAEANHFAYDVQGGQISIQGTGVEGTVGRLDLIGESLAIDAPLRAHYLNQDIPSINLSAGKRRVEEQADGGYGVAETQTPAPVPVAYAIDASAMGAMTAGQIRIISTDQGLGVNMAGPLVAYQQDIAVSTAGATTLGRLAAARNIQLDSSGNLTVSQDTTAGGWIDATSGGAVAFQGGLAANGDVTLTGATGAAAVGDVQVGGKLAVEAGSGLLQLGGEGRAVTIVGDADLSGGEILQQGHLEVGGILHAEANGGGEWTGNVVVGAEADIQAGAGLGVSGDWSVNQDLQFAGDTILVSGDVTVGHDYDVKATTQAVLGGQSLVGNILHLDAPDVAIAGPIDAAWTSVDGGSLQLGVAGQTLVIGGDLNLGLDGSLDVLGGLDVQGNASLVCGADEHFAGDVSVGGELAFQAGGTLALNGAVSSLGLARLVAGGDLAVRGPVSAVEITASGHTATFGAGLVSTGDILLLGGVGLAVAGDIAAGGSLDAQSGGDLDIGGAIASAGETRLVAEGGLGVEGAISAGRLTASGRTLTFGSGLASASDVVMAAGQALAIAGAVTTAGAFDAQSGGSLDLGGPIRSGGDTRLVADGNLAVQGDVTASRIVAAGQSVQFAGNLTGAGDIRLVGGQELAVAGAIDSGANFDAQSGGGMQLGGSVHAGGEALLVADGGLAAAADVTAGRITVAAGSATLNGSLSSTSDIELIAGDALSVAGGIAAAGNVAAQSGGSLDLAGSVDSAGATLLVADGDLTVGGPIRAASIAASGGTARFVGELASTGSIQLIGGQGLTADAAVTAGTTLSAQSGGDLHLGGPVTATGQALLVADGALSALGQVNAGHIVASGGTASFMAGLDSGSDIILSAGEQLVVAGVVNVVGNLDAQSAGDMAFDGGIHAGGQAVLVADGALTTQGTITAADIVASADVAHFGGDLSSLGDIQLVAGQTLAVGGAVDVLGDLMAQSGGTLALGNSVHSNGATLLVADGSLTVAGPVDAARVTASGGTAHFLSSLASAGDIDLVTATGLVVEGAIAAAGNLGAQAGGDLHLGGNVTTGGETRLVADGALTGLGDLGASRIEGYGGTAVFSGNLAGTDAIRLVAGQSLQVAGTVDTLGNLDAQSGGDLGLSSRVQAGGEALLVADGTLDTQSVSAGRIAAAGGTTHVGGDLAATGDIIAIGRDGLAVDGGVTAAGSFSGQSDGNLELGGRVQTGGETLLNAAGNVVAQGPIQASRITASGTDVSFAGSLTSLDDILLLAAGNLAAQGDVQAAGNLAAQSGGHFHAGGTLTSGSQAVLESGGDMRLDGQATAATGLWLHAGGDIQAGQGLQAGALDVAGRQVQLAGDIAVGGESRFDVAGLTLGGDLRSGTIDIRAGAAGVQSLGAMNSHLDLLIDSLGGIDIADAQALRDIQLSSQQGATQAGNLVAGRDLDLAAWAGIGVLDAQAGRDLTTASQTGSQSFAAAQAGRDIQLASGHGIAVAGTLAANGTVGATAGGLLAVAGPVQSGGNLVLSGQAVDLGATVYSAADATLTATGGPIAIADGVQVAGNAVLTGSSIAIEGVQTGGTLALDATAGTLQASTNLIAGGDLGIHSAGNASVQGTIATGGNADIAGLADADLADIVADGELNVATQGRLDTGRLQAQGNVQLASGGDIHTQAIVSGGWFDGFAGGSFGSDGDIAADAIAITAQGGDLAVSGAIAAPGAINLAAGGAITAGLVQGGTAAGERVSVDAGGDVQIGNLQAGGDYQAQTGGGHRVAGNWTVNGHAGIAAGGNVEADGPVRIGNGYQVQAGGAIRHAGDTLILGDANLQSGGSQDYTGDLSVTGALNGTAGQGIAVGSDLWVNGAITLDGGSGGIAVGGALATQADATLQAQGDIQVGGPAWFQHGNFTSQQGGVRFGADVEAGDGLAVSAKQDIAFAGRTVAVAGLTATSSSGDIAFAQDLAVNGAFIASARNDLEFHGNSQFLGTTDLDAQTGRILNLAEMTLAQDFTLATTGDFVNESVVQVSGNADLSARNIVSNQATAGGIVATGSLGAHASGSLTVGSQGALSAANGMALSAGSGLHNHGQIQTGGTLAYSGGTFNNYGQTAADSVVIHAGANNGGTLYGDSVTIAGYTSNSGQIAGNTLDLGGLGNSGTVSGNSLHLGSTHNSGNIVGAGVSVYGNLTNSGSLGALGSLHVSGGTLDNSGDLQGGTVDLSATSLGNSGEIQSVGNLTIAATTVTNSVYEGNTCVADYYICHQINYPDGSSPRPLDPATDYRWTQTVGLIHAGGAADITAGSLVNQGVINSGGDLHLAVAGALNNTRSPNDLLTYANHGQANPSTNTGLIAAGGALAIEAGSLTNSGGKLQATGTVTLDVAGALNNLAPQADLTGAIQGHDVTLSVGGLNNDGLIEASGGALAVSSTVGDLGNDGILRALGDITVATGGLFVNGTGAKVLTDETLAITADSVLNDGSLYGVTGPADHIVINAPGGFSNLAQGIVIAGLTLDLDVGRYYNAGTVGSFNDATLKATIVYTPATAALIAHNHLDLQVNGLQVDAPQTWVAGSQWVSWTGTLTNYGIVDLKHDATGDIHNLASGGTVTRTGAPPGDGSYAPGTAPAELTNAQITAYTDVGQRAYLRVGGYYDGHLYNQASDIWIGSGNLHYTADAIDQTVTWSGQDIGGDPVDVTAPGQSTPRLLAGGYAEITLDTSTPGTIIAENAVIYGGDLTLGTGADTTAAQQAIAAAQNNQVDPGAGADAGGTGTTGGQVDVTGTSNPDPDNVPDVQISDPGGLSLTGPDGGALPGASGQADGLIPNDPEQLAKPQLETPETADDTLNAGDTTEAGNTLTAEDNGSAANPDQADNPDLAEPPDGAGDPLTPDDPGSLQPGAGEDYWLALPEVDLGTPEAGAAALLAGDLQPVYPEWDQLDVAPGSISAQNLELYLTGLFTNRGQLDIVGDLLIDAAAGIDNEGAVIQAGGFLMLRGGGLNNVGGLIEADSLWGDLSDSVDNTHGQIQVAGQGFMSVDGDLVNDSGRITSGSLLLAVTGNLYNRTLLAEDETGHTEATTTTVAGGYDQTTTTVVSTTEDIQRQTADTRAGIATTSGDLSLAVGGDLIMQGADLLSAGRLIGRIAGNIQVSALGLTNSHDTSETTTSITQQLLYRDEGGYQTLGQSESGHQTHESQTSYLLANLGAGEGIDLAAGGDASYLGVDFSSGGDTLLGAAGNLTIRSLVATTESRTESHSSTETPGFDGSLMASETHQVDETANQSLVGGTIESGGRVLAVAGNQVELTGLAIQAQGGVQVEGLFITSGVQTLENKESHSTSTSSFDGLVQRGHSDSQSETLHIGTRVESGGDVNLLAIQPEGTDLATGVTLTSIQLHGEHITVAATGNVLIDSAVDHTIQDSRNLDGTRIETHETAQTNASRLDGSLVTIAGADVTVDATDILSDGKARIAATGNLSLGATVDGQYDHTLITRESGGFLTSKTSESEHTYQSLTAHPATITAGSVELSAGGDMALYGTAIDATDGVVQVTAGGAITAYALQDQELTIDRHRSDSSFLGITYSHHATSDSVLTQTALVTQVQSTDSLVSRSGGDTHLQATQIAAPVVDIQAGVGDSAKTDAQVILEGVKETLQTSHTEESSSLVWMQAAGEGGTTETLRQPDITGTLTLTAPGGIIAQLPEGDFRSQLEQASLQPGQEWLNQLAQAGNVDWQQIALAHDHWEYEQEGLSGPAAMIIAIVVAAVTAGAGASAVAGLTDTAAVTTASGVVEFTATEVAQFLYPTASAVANAAITSLASQAAISLINNQGDLGATLEDLGSSDTVKQIVASMVTAGTTASFGGEFGPTRLIADAAAGCVSGELTGSGCQAGATNAAAMSGLAWVSDAMRQTQIESSEQFAGICDGQKCISNATGQSAGVNNDWFKLGGGRLDMHTVCETLPDMCLPDKTIDPFYLDSFGRVILPEDMFFPDGSAVTVDSLIAKLPVSALGGIQGSAGSVTVLGMTFNYSPGSFTDTVIESFAGPHDFLNSPHYYDALGNSNQSLTGAWEGWNWVNLVPAAPFGLATLCTQSPGLCSSMTYAVSNAGGGADTEPSNSVVVLQNDGQLPLSVQEQ